MFDFNKAINGEPVYYEGNQIELCWYPKDQRFTAINKKNAELLGVSAVPIRIDNKGRMFSNDKIIGHVSTDPPPKRKVKLDIWYNLFTKKYNVVESELYGQSSVVVDSILIKTIEVEI